MKIDYISGDGIHQAEKAALNRMREIFNGSSFSQSWHGFAGFEMIDRVHRDREIDLVLLTHDRVLLIELKNWHGKITPMKDRWLRNNQDMGRSAVITIAAKLKIFAGKMKRLPEPARSAWNEYRVVLCGSEDYKALPEDEKAFIVRLEDFLKIATRGNYEKMFGKPRFGAVNPSAYVSDFAKLIRGPEFKATGFSFNNFQIDGDPLFEHRDHLYKEYRSLQRDDRKVQALLRRWDFSTLAGKADTIDERASIGLREHKVLGFLQDCSEEVYGRFLQPLTFPTRDDVDADFCELYRLPPRHLRLSAFLNKYGTTLTVQERLSLVKALLSHFADIHDLGVAHRDIGDHTLWLERPSQVSISGLLTAYFPEAGTVGELKQFLSTGEVRLPEEAEDFGRGTASSPFRRDVFLLGVAAHQILFVRRPQISSSVGIFYWEHQADDPYRGTLDKWFETALDPVPEDRFASAREMLNALNGIAAIAGGTEHGLDFGLFEIYRTDILPYVTYSIEENLKQGRAHVYRSSSGPLSVCVKIWNSAVPDQKRIGEAHRLLHFLERIRQVKAQQCSVLPLIADFGVSQAGTFLVTGWLDGKSLEDTLTERLPQRDALNLCKRLAAAVQSMHASGIDHGDISPEHILVSGDNLQFIDALDFHREGQERPFNVAYGPPDAESIPASERDCFAAAKIMSEILSKSLSGELDESSLKQELQRCLDRDSGMYRLERIADTLDSLLHPETGKEVVFRVFDKVGERLMIPNDNGGYHVNVFPDRKSKNHVMLSATGVRTQILLSIDKETKEISWARAGEIAHSQFVQLANRAIAELRGYVEILPARKSDYSALAKATLLIPSVAEAFEEMSGKAEPAVLHEEAEETSPPTKEIWKALIEAEEATLPEVTVAGPTTWDMERFGRLIIPYSKAGEPLDYGPDDRISVLQENAGDTNKIGELNTQETSPTSMVVDRVERNIRLHIGSRIKLHSVQDRSSFQKRRSAAIRIAEQQSVIPNLLDYFDPSKNAVPTIFSDPPIDKDLDVYDVYEDGQRIFSLNKQQREAFSRLWVNGPVSLLQGPPGTGKTAFIASFIHYAFKAGAHQILLASQSHEAVNNAAEKVVELCTHTSTPLGIVRFGSEGMISDPLRPYHVNSILTDYRDLFRAEMRERIASLAPNLGLSRAFVEEWWRIESQLGRVVREIKTVDQKIKGAAEDTKLRLEALEKKRNKRLDLFYRIASSQFGINDNADPDTILQALHQKASRDHAIASPDALRRLEHVAQLSQEWLDRLATLRGNFEEFLAKTRNLVCGTCVGLGRAEFGIVNMKYDWVIIDEAARATPGELAVALQTGRRVVLVGDHRQLPPLYTREAIDHMAAKFPGVERTALTQSDFERAFESEYGRQVGATLQIQYRMAPPIGDLVSHCFYPIPLTAGRQEAKSFLKELPVGARATVTWIDTSEAQSQAFERPRPNHGKENSYEARVILALLKSISTNETLMSKISLLAVEERHPIGIICMYADQKTLLQKMLSEQEWAVDIKSWIKIDTVDSYQGKENPIIIVSLTRNNERGEQGFLLAPERINVAVSRAMERLVIVGAARMWTDHNPQSPLGEVLKFLRSKIDGVHYQICSSNEVLQRGAYSETRATK